MPSATGSRQEYPHWPGQQIFDVARLVNAALMAKIHTVEWTPAILGHPALEIGMNANWWGLATEKIKRIFGRISQSEAISGIPGSGVNHHGADYCLTEEFVTVYRMHPLIPDELRLLSVTTGRDLRSFTLPDGVIGDQARLTALSSGATMADLFYSFGRLQPGGDHPAQLPELPARPDAARRRGGRPLDDRHPARPRAGRAALQHLPRAAAQAADPARSTSWPTRCTPGLPDELRAVYGQTDGRDNVDLLDTMVGMFAETPPRGSASATPRFGSSS